MDVYEQHFVQSWEIFNYALYSNQANITVKCLDLDNAGSVVFTETITPKTGNYYYYQFRPQDKNLPHGNYLITFNDGVDEKGVYLRVTGVGPWVQKY